MKNKEIGYRFIHYLFGALPARLGDEMSGQTILLIGFSATQTVELGSMLLAGLTLSAALGGPLLGVILDRSRLPGRVLAGALGCYVLGLVLITITLGHVPLWISVVIALMAGFLMPAISGGWSSRLKTFIADEHITRVSTIDASTFNIAGLAGPALAGLIAATLGAYWAMVILVMLLVAALPMAWLLPGHAAYVARRSSLHQDIIAGFCAIVINKMLLRITLTSVISYMGIGMLWVICPLMGQTIFGDAAYGGLLMSIVSVGALITTLFYAKWPTRHSPDRIALITTAILAGAMLVLVFAGEIPLVILAMLLVGLADGPQLAAIFAVRHREAPNRLRSQVFTTGASLKITAAAVGAAVSGQLAGISLEVTVVAACLVQIVAALTFIFITFIIRRPQHQSSISSINGLLV